MSSTNNMIYNGMTDYEKIECAINKLRVFGSTTDVKDLLAKEKKKKKSLVVADSETFKKYLYPLAKEIPNISSLIFEGYFVDISESLFIKNPGDAITELARRIEQVYLYNNTKGNMLPKEYMSIESIYTLAETDLKDYKYLRLLPVFVRIKFKDSNKKSILKLCDYGHNLLPYVIDEKHGMSCNEIENAIISYKNDIIAKNSDFED